MNARRILLFVFSVLLVTVFIIIKISYSQENNIITSDTYEIKDNTIYAIPTSEKFLVSELLENINYSNAIDVLDKSGNALDDSDSVGTGFKVRTSDVDFDIVVLGDVTGDGNISFGDVSKLYNTYLKKTSLSGSYLRAGRVTKNTNISFGDVSKLYNYYKGNSAFSYYNKDHPDGITNKVDKTVNTLNDLKASTLSVGKVIKTKGYYEANDGGSAKYIIESNNNQTIDNGSYVKLNNGNVAKLLIGKNTVNVKQFGAKGDGVTDDHLYFKRATNSSAKIIKIPNGTYNMNDNITTINKFIKFVGNGEDKTIIKNGTIKSQYGVRAENITFDGGANQHIDYVGTDSLDEDGEMIFVVIPNGPRDVIYKNCTFKNVKIASFAKDDGKRPEDTIIRKNIVENCKFLNIGKTAIYHNMRMGSGVYIGNTFSEIGSRDLLKGFISALFLGDITNNTRYEANDILIKNNTFKNLYTKDNFDDDETQTHIINANFIAIRADKALIDNNTVTNLIGYGHDREGIYTKVRDLTISNNVLTNAGLGEGYVCAKAHSGLATFNIINNTFNGDAGCAIRDYGPGLVSGNKINITNTLSGITGTISGTVDVGDNKLIIKDNIFKSGTSSTLDVNGTIINSYTTNRIIKLTDVNLPLEIDNNTFDTLTSYEVYVSVNGPGNSLKIRNNKFKLVDKTGTGIFISNGAQAAVNSLNNTTIIDGNNFEVNDSIKELVWTRLGVDGTGSASRNIKYTNNYIKFNGSKTVTAIRSESSKDNNDTLTVKGNTSNVDKSKIIINNKLKNYVSDNDNFATLS